MKRFRNFIRILILSLGLCFVLIPEEVRAEDTSVINAQLLSSMNALRSSVGVAPLSLDSSLGQVAAIRAQEASTTWSHTRPNGTQGISLLPSNKWRGENLAYVQYASFGFSQSEQAAAAALMFANLKASPTHYNNMVFGNFKKVGICTYVLHTSGGYRLTTAFMFTN